MKWSLIPLAVVLAACTSMFPSEAEPVESPFSLGVNVKTTAAGATEMDGSWSQDVELRIGETDAATLEIPEVTKMSPGSPNGLFVRFETALMGDDESDLGFCLSDEIVLVDTTQDLEHVVAGEGYCFRNSHTFRLQANFQDS